MNKKQFFIGLTVWVLLLFWGSGWAFEPYRTVGVQPQSTMETSEQFVRRTFKVRLAPLATTPVGGYVSRLTSDDQEEGGFDALAWSVRETKRRFALVLLFLMISGVAVHWIVSQILRGVKDYAE
jgi:hypothetical protein